MIFTKKHYSKCSVFAFGFETCIKTILPLINRLINEALLVADHVSITCCFSLIEVPHWFRINMFLRVGFSWCLQTPGAGALVHITVMSCCSMLKQLLPDICQAPWRLLLSSATRVRKSTELLWHKTPDFTPDVASQQTTTRPQFCRLQITESHSGMCLSETVRDVKHRWGAVVINRIFY